MILHVIEAKYINEYKIWVSFNNGRSGIIDLKEELTGEVFEPLNNLEEFKKISIHPIMETLVWENGADFAPEYLLDLLESPIQSVG
jgi:hypothetical protein